MLLGRAKSCRWQVFVRRRPPKQGELRTDVSKATMFQGDRKVSKIFCPTFCALQKVGKRSRRKAAKGFNWVRAKPPLRRAESRFGKPRCSLQRERVVTFCVVQKVTKKHAGLRPATSIQSSVGNTLGEFSGGTCRTWFFAQNGGEKALNRCDIPVLQREDLERTTKE